MGVLLPIESTALADSAFESIRGAIISGTLAQGEPLREAALALALGVSRTPIREALHGLAITGLVTARPRAGWNVGFFTEDDVHEVFQVRRLLEPAGIDQLAKGGGKEALRKLQTFFDSYHAPIAKNSLDEYFARDRAFHELIVSCTKNSRIIQFYSVLANHIDWGRHFLIQSTAGRVEKTLDEHRSITSALAAHDFGAARETLIEHLKAGEELLSNLERSKMAGPSVGGR